MAGDVETIGHYNHYTNMDTGNFWYQFKFKDRRDDISADLTWFVDGLGGSHEVKGGVQYSRTGSEGSGCYTGTTSTEFCAQGDSGLFFEDIEIGGAVPYLMWEEEAAGFASYAGTVSTAFAQDAWRVTRDLTLKLGLRYEAIEYRDNDGTQVADMAELQPRIGIVWDLSGDAKNVLRGSWGRYLHPSSQALPEFASTLPKPAFYWYSCSGVVSLPDPDGFGIPISSADECENLAADWGWDYRTDPENWDPYGWILAPWEHYYTEPGVIDPNLRATYADELILAYEREIRPRSSIELTYVDKKTRYVYDETCGGNVPTPSPDAACDYFVMKNFSELRRDYEAFIVKYENRGLDWLTLLTSYTYSNSKGSVEASNYQGTEVDLYPWHFENRYGYLSDHRRHRIKLNGFVSFKGDWTIAFDGRWSSGFRWTPQATQTDNPDIRWGSYFVEPRGNREGYDERQLDLQLSKGFNLGRVRFVLIGSVFNVFSSEQAVAVCQRISGCGGFEMGEPLEWQIPRRYEIGFRVEF
jgi:outer membrane receptor protein involved in Fe transport